MSAERTLMNEFKELSKEPWTNVEVSQFLGSKVAGSENSADVVDTLFS